MTHETSCNHDAASGEQLDVPVAPRKDMADSPGGTDADPRVVAAISQGESVSRLCWSDDFGVHPDRPGMAGGATLNKGKMTPWEHGIEIH